MHTDKIFDTTNTKKVNTTKFEINDAGREHEYHGNSYIKPFASFIESLGYEVILDASFAKVTINGHKFEIDIDSASFRSRNGWTREKYDRKPENRVVKLTDGSYGNTYVLKVQINKELDADKLRSKIDKAIKSRVDNVEKMRIYNQQQHDNTVTVNLHYLSNSIIKKNTDRTLVAQGKITFMLKNDTNIEINADGSFLESTVYKTEFKSVKEVDEFIASVNDRMATLKNVISEILNTPPLSAELQEWSQKQYHRYFYVKTMSVEK